ncbi:zinc-binding dehydrogenase [Bacillus mycoides]|uniref:zinc-binding dehydrogenase n=1 Tax=Bacillus mycoides TaxID=1405 RepID=UPI002E1BAD6C|nr:zinc-binding dehydrogenase [Bacillus mycoides]
MVARPSQEKVQELGVRAEHHIALPNHEALQDVAQLMAEGEIKPIISKTLSLEEAPQAHKLSQIRHGRGRIVLNIID